jgi:L-threonylcarbamoyladenylate synthase
MTNIDGCGCFGFSMELSGNHLKIEVGEAAETLRSGGLVAYPTESFYGLAADIGNETAILRLFRVKKRATGKPVLLLIPSVESLKRYATIVPEPAQRLMDAFWPGGLTLIFEARKDVSMLLTAGTGKVGIRLSSHPIATALAQAMGSAITGTSANISGALPCNTSHGVASALGKGVDRILDGGETPGQMPSTVLDMTTRPPTVLREGLISQEALSPYF